MGSPACCSCRESLWGRFKKAWISQVLLWALLNVLERCDRHVQTFLSQARFAPHNGAVCATGQRREPRPYRHLDSWLMSWGTCREIFCHGVQSCDLAVVEGCYDAARVQQATLGGSLDTLCDWLALPRLVVLDASRMDYCRFPRPDQLDGLLLDRVPNDDEACRLTTNLEALWGAPVIGMLGELPTLRSAVANLPRGANPSHELCCALGDRLVQRLRLDRLLEVARRHQFPSTPNHLFRRRRRPTAPTVAVAYDEVFNCYFPDTLDLLETRGAKLRDFSPLRSERLPPGVNLVYLGCGNVERHAEALAANHCMKQALRHYAARGGRVYAEGGGLAYLCRYLALAQGCQVSMTGVLPAVARLARQPGPICPVEISLASNTWLGAARSRLRGYLDPRWEIEPLGTLASYAAEPQSRRDLVGCGNVFGTRVHLDFAAQPQFLESFFRPPSLACLRPT